MCRHIYRSATFRAVGHTYKVDVCYHVRSRNSIEFAIQVKMYLPYGIFCFTTVRYANTVIKSEQKKKKEVYKSLRKWVI